MKELNELEKLTNDSPQNMTDVKDKRREKKVTLVTEEVEPPPIRIEYSQKSASSKGSKRSNSKNKDKEKSDPKNAPDSPALRHNGSLSRHDFSDYFEK